MGYISLHTHTTFSLLDSYGLPEQYVRRAKEIGSPALALTEHGNTSSHIQLEKACKEWDIKPIYGVELYIVEDIKNNTRDKNHITVLAKDLTGYKNLLKLTSMAYEDGYFYYFPTIDVQALVQNQEGLIILSGCLKGLLSTRVADGEIGKAIEVAEGLKRDLKHFYIEVQPLGLEESVKVNRGLITIARKLDIPLVATNDVHYVEPGDENVQWFLSSVRRRKNVHDQWGTMDSRCFLASEANMLEWGIPWLGMEEAIANTVKVANLCESFDLPKARVVQYGVEDTYSAVVDWCREGWKARKIPRAVWPEYKHRLFHELGLIREKGYLDYFLVVADMVRWAKENGIMVGPARGSVAGSLVAYLMGTTEVDPIRWDLLFERFIDVSRYDPPDIDLDFQDDRRDEVKDYLRSKYGEDRVANIAGYSMFKPKSLLDDIGRVLKIPKKTIEDAKSELIENGGKKHLDEVIAEVAPDRPYLAAVEGMVRQLTVHAAGVVVASEPIKEFTTMGREGIMLDYRDAEHIGLMKIDILSLKTLTILKHCLEAIGKDAEWLYNEVPLDDRATLEAFSGNDFMGVFQYEGAATKRVCQQVKPTSFEELVDINALSRPGPLQSGATEAYIRGWWEDLHPVVTKWTERSRGQILFQEQIMRILKDAGGLSWQDVTAVRKLITKKQGAEKLEGIRKRFIEGIGDERLGEEVWRRCGESGAYGFNVAHSTSYTYLGYYCMYLKVHYPLEFYWANLMVEPDNEEILWEYARKGTLYGVKFGRSKAGWSIDGDGLRAGYLTLKGIGPKTAEKLEAGVEPKGKVKETLQKAGAFEEKENGDYLGMEELIKKMEAVKDRTRIQDAKPGEYIRVAGVVAKLQVKNLREIVEAQGRNYEEEVKDPEKDTYINMVLSDETGEMPVTVNRFKCADPVLFEMVTENKELVITGEFSEQYRKLYANRIEILGAATKEEEW